MYELSLLNSGRFHLSKPWSRRSFRSFQGWKLESFIESASILHCSCAFIYHRWMKVLFVLHIEWFYSREQEMSLWLDALEGFSALFIDPLKFLSLIVKFSFHSSALTLWIFPCLLAIFYLTFSLLRLYLFICLNTNSVMVCVVCIHAFAVW